jgi:hypothetical protein
MYHQAKRRDVGYDSWNKVIDSSTVKMNTCDEMKMRKR